MYREELSVPATTGAAASAAPVARSSRSLWRALLREPLTHFVAIGVLIFAGTHWLEAHSRRYAIAITPADLTRIASSYEQQYGTAPTSTQLRTMVDGRVREEIFLREGLALGLDRNDEIVRRRIAQKYQFLQADLTVPREPSETELREWYAAHAAAFAEPARRSFEQRYFAIDGRGETNARELAQQARARLDRGEAAQAGDAFPGPAVISHLAADEVERLFGGAQFAQAVFAAPTGRWSGPFRRGFGWHLIRVTEASPSTPRSFDDARNEARIAWQQADRAARNDEAYRRLLARYTVTRADQP